MIDGVRIRQRAYLSLKSRGLTPDEITELLGVQPDDAKPMGSRLLGPPPRPAAHMWAMHSGIGEDAALEQHLGALWPRLEPLEDALRLFTSRADSSGWLKVVREFEDGDEDFDETTYGLPEGADFVRLAGQHPFLGWSLSAERLRFLGTSGIGVAVDEYG